MRNYFVLVDLGGPGQTSLLGDSQAVSSRMKKDVDSQSRRKKRKTPDLSEELEVVILGRIWQSSQVL